jgi:hypothetical protein
MDANIANGGVHMGWVERKTLATNENLYIGHRIVATPTGIQNSWIDDFSLTVIRLDDLAADDFRFNGVSNAYAVTTSFANDAIVTLPSTSGDDWLVWASGNWDVGSASIGMEQQINVSTTGAQMYCRREGEDPTEQLAIMCVGYVPSAGASATVALQAKEVTSTNYVLDSSRVFALRLDAFADHEVSHIDSGGIGALSGVLDTYAQAATINLSLAATGPVYVVGQATVDDTANTALTSDPYLQLQENNTDIVSGFGRATDHFRDANDQIGVWKHCVGTMTSGTKTIDLDVARDETAAANHVFVNYTLAAFSMELAGGSQSIVKHILLQHAMRNS